MRIQLPEIVDASKCLRFFTFLKSARKPPRPLELRVAELAIKKAYLVGLESGYRADWRRIVGWVDSAVFEQVELTDEKAFEDAKLASEHILKFISSWYHSTYMVENIPVYTDVPLEAKLGRNMITGCAPVVKLQEIPVITVFSDVVTPAAHLYNQIEIRGLQWMLSETLEKPTIQVDCMQLGPRGGIETSTMYATTKDHERAKEVINQVGSMIAAGFDTPSYTEMCNSCPFKGRCKI